MSPSADRDSISRAGSDASALERVVARFDALIRQSARSRGLSPADIDELVQDVRVRLWRTQASDEKLEALGASYMKRVASSAAIDLLRRRRARREDSLDELDMTSATPVALQSPSPDRSDDAELAQRLELALAQIARNRRLVVQLHLEGYPRDEIATLTGWTEAKVRNLLYRGLEELRANMRHDASENPSGGGA